MIEWLYVFEGLWLPLLVVYYVSEKIFMILTLVFIFIVDFFPTTFLFLTGSKFSDLDYFSNWSILASLNYHYWFKETYQALH